MWEAVLVFHARDLAVVRVIAGATNFAGDKSVKIAEHVMQNAPSCIIIEALH